MRSLKGSKNNTTNSLQEERNVELENTLIHEKNRSDRLKQELEITEKKLKETTNNQIYMKINKSMGAPCEEHHTSFTSLVLIGLFFLVLGFTMGKFSEN